MHYYKIIWLNVFCCLAATQSFSQNQTNNWYFGQNAGLNFSNGRTAVLNNSAMDAPAGCSVISDKNGDLLFYTNGQTVWNKNHDIMDNGTNLAGQITNNQSALIVPKPNDPEAYFILTTRDESSENGEFLASLYYSEIQISEDNPLGTITSKNNKLRSNVSQRLAGIYNPANNSYSVITHGRSASVANSPYNIFMVYKIDVDGLNTVPSVSFHNEIVGTNGALKISPNGKYLALADYDGRSVYTYNFDINSSTIAMADRIIPQIPFTQARPYGLEFSQDSNILYFSGELGGNSSLLFKWSMTEVDGPERQKLIANTNFNIGSLQLARNGKIYAASYQSNNTDNYINWLSVINKPENFEASSDFQELSLNLQSGNSRKGLPIFVASDLRNHIKSMDVCANEAFNFELDTYAPINSVIWDFGDNNTSTEISPEHYYNQSGIYTVKATIDINNCIIDLYKRIEALSVPNPLDGQSLGQCVSNGSEMVTFNLLEIQDKLGLTNIEYSFNFYSSLEDLESESNEIEIPDVYENNGQNEELFVKIVTPNGCSGYTSFFLETNFTDVIEIESIFACENSDGIDNNDQGLFVLRNKTAEILQFFNVEDGSVSFYDSYEDAQLEVDELPLNFNSISKSIWARLERDEDCTALITFDLVVRSSMQSEIENNYTLCYNPGLSSITLDGGSDNQFWEWKDSANQIISEQREITITNPGQYSLTAYRTSGENLCSRTWDFTVDEADQPEFSNIETSNGEIRISVSGSDDYRFSIDGDNFEGNGTSHLFENLRGGIYTIYVQDSDGCEKLIETTVSIISFPKFFTPNNDGYNDSWKIYGVSSEFYKSSEVKIYDRYGKLLSTINMSSNIKGWAGLFNGKELSSTDFWFEAHLIDLQGNEIHKSGHFSLKR